MKKKEQTPSQVVDLLLHVAAELGATDAREIAAVADGTPENVANWRSGAVQELKTRTLDAVKRGLAARIRSLRERAHDLEAVPGLTSLELEADSGPAELMRQLRDQARYDYLGHRFLYFDPQGAIAWEKVIESGYDQDAWLRGVRSSARSFLDARARPAGPLASVLGLDGRTKARALDVVSLGPGEGQKEAIVLAELGAAVEPHGVRAQLTFALVDVSVPLLLKAVAAMRAEPASASVVLLPFCADFEEGSLAFAARLPTAHGTDGARLVLLLGNVFGNVRDEERFLDKKLFSLVRPGDFVWLEVGLRAERIADDPLFRLTQQANEETASETNRRLLLEGPYRRLEAASGRPPSDLSLRVWVREDDDSCRIPGSLNFCHDLVLRDERRSCTMLYSRRYALDPLVAWLERRGLVVERLSRTEDARGRPRVAHLLLRRK